ncbi:carbohydrate-binding module family 13 protein [Hebeloma cylindrosporum]|uniref:Carbohydrate-binding module family 13 protein n=1 Tax=Hebeloma cylindrosporum TaxID=76867 RepID=A0A0C3C9M9_HEBCY|nr:carbohydrate-binding module family 13 protein [Hebeloma cylindrosporum h7]
MRIFNTTHIRLLLPLLIFVSVNAERDYTIKNKCPAAIDLYINGRSEGTIARNAQVHKSFAEDWSGLIYTTANGGRTNGKRTTMAGFYGAADYYYIVNDPKNHTVGVRIAPKSRETKGFCIANTCNSRDCAAFGMSPTRFPIPTSAVPTLPLSSCPGSHIGYTVTFCPRGTFPAPTASVEIHPNGNVKKCLDVRGAQYENGTPVQIFECNGTPAQRWAIQQKSNSTRVVLAGTPYCLDAGQNPHNGAGMKLWRCNGKLAAQNWKYVKDGLFKFVGNGTSNVNLCLDLTKGSQVNSNQVQTWTCNGSNTNQIWTTSVL